MNLQWTRVIALTAAVLCASTAAALAAPKLKIASGPRELDNLLSGDFNSVIQTRTAALPKSIGGFMATWVTYSLQVFVPFIFYTYSSHVAFYDKDGNLVQSLGLAPAVTSNGTFPTIDAAPAAFRDGSSLVLYSAGDQPKSQNVLTQRFTSSFAASGNPHQVNDDKSGIEGHVAAALLPSQAVAGIWDLAKSNGDPSEVHGRLIAKSGRASGPDLSIAQHAAAQTRMMIPLSNNMSAFAYKAGSAGGYHVERLDSTGAPLDSIALPVADNSGPGLAPLPNGGYVAVFAEARRGKTFLIAQIVSANGKAGTATKIGTVTPSGFLQPQVALEAGVGGRIIAVTNEQIGGTPTIVVRALDQNGNLLTRTLVLTQDSKITSTDALSLLSDKTFLAVWDENLPDPDNPGNVTTRPFAARFAVTTH